jgi:hypothetical protein
MSQSALAGRRLAPQASADLSRDATRDIAEAMDGIPSDRFVGRQSVADSDSDYAGPPEMLVELLEHNVAPVERLRDGDAAGDEDRDVAPAGLIQTWIYKTERRKGFLFETGRPVDSTGR